MRLFPEYGDVCDYLWSSNALTAQQSIVLIKNLHGILIVLKMFSKKNQQISTL